jgi:hypothetical protein
MSGTTFPVEYFLDVGAGPHTFDELSARMKLHVEAAHGGGSSRLPELDWANAAKTMRFEFQKPDARRILLVVSVLVDESGTICMDLEPRRGRRRMPPGPLARVDDAEQEAIDSVARHFELTSKDIRDLAHMVNSTSESELVRKLAEFGQARHVSVDQLLAYLTSKCGPMSVRVGGREVHFDKPGVRRRVPGHDSVPARLVPRQQDRKKVAFVGIALTKPASGLKPDLVQNRNRRHEFSTASPQAAGLLAAAQHLGVPVDVFLRSAVVVKPGVPQIPEIERLADEPQLLSDVMAALRGEAPGQSRLFDATDD